jgi:hypothetical protein
MGADDATQALSHRRWPVVIEETLPRALGPYVLLARIGRGGMGDVYVARHGSVSGFEKHCVLKMLRDDRIHDPELLARFAEESTTEVLGKLTAMAPEQARGESVDHRADQFSTAVMLTEVLLSQGLHVHAYGSRR